MSVLAIFGPTGVGKTGVAIALARLLRERGESPLAISCDALQVYAGLGVLTGAASAAEQAELEHRLIGFVPVTQTFNVGAYMPLAHAEIDADGVRVTPVGGAGSHLIAGLAQADALVVLAEGVTRVDQGDQVPVLLLDRPAG